MHSGFNILVIEFCWLDVSSERFNSSKHNLISSGGSVLPVGEALA